MTEIPNKQVLKKQVIYGQKSTLSSDTDEKKPEQEQSNNE